MTHHHVHASRQWSVAAIILLALLACSCEEAPVYPGDSPDQATQDDILPVDPPSDEMDTGTFSLHCINTSVRSYIGGGGVFIIAIKPDPQFSGTVQLAVEADPLLAVQLTRYRLDEFISYAELTVEPCAPIAQGTSTITVRATHHGRTITRQLDVDLYEWEQNEPGTEIIKRDEFVSWLAKEHPEVGDLSAEQFRRYMTYPQILIVEHWTFLNQDWEFRVCFHVMIPPHDWSMMLLRRRGCAQPLLAARRDSDGTIAEIPVDEYPVLLLSAHH